MCSHHFELFQKQEEQYSAHAVNTQACVLLFEPGLEEIFGDPKVATHTRIPPTFLQGTASCHRLSHTHSLSHTHTHTHIHIQSAQSRQTGPTIQCSWYWVSYHFSQWWLQSWLWPAQHTTHAVWLTINIQTHTQPHTHTNTKNLQTRKLLCQSQTHMKRHKLTHTHTHTRAHRYTFASSIGPSELRATAGTSERSRRISGH